MSTRASTVVTALAACILAVSACSPPVAVSSPGAPAPAINPGDWLTYNRTLAGDRFSPLSEINRSNVAQLRTICSYTRPEYQFPAAHFWTSFTLDAANGILYVPSGNPAPDFDIELPNGDNLYTNSVIAIDAANGRMLGYNQIVKRDFHDWDVDSPPALVTTRSGRAIVASSNKDGLLSVLDRSRVSRNKVTTSQSDLAEALPLMYQVPITTRENVDVPLSRERKVRFCPGIMGGTEWNGAAYSPQLNTLYAGAVDSCVSLQLQSANTPIPAAGQSWLGAQTPMAEMFDAPDKARGWVTAVDANNGSVRWKFPAPKPILAAVTPTAGGLLFTADLGGQLYALDVTRSQQPLDR